MERKKECLDLFEKISEKVSNELSKKLKTCPFCGETAKIDLRSSFMDYKISPRENDDGCDFMIVIFAKYEVKCENECSIFERKLEITFRNKDAILKYRGPVEIVEEWNKRNG